MHAPVLYGSASISSTALATSGDESAHVIRPTKYVTPLAESSKPAGPVSGTLAYRRASSLYGSSRGCKTLRHLGNL